MAKQHQYYLDGQTLKPCKSGPRFSFRILSETKERVTLLRLPALQLNPGPGTFPSVKVTATVVAKCKLHGQTIYTLTN